MGEESEGLALRPLPLADESSSGFWDAARDGRLAIQRCRSCRRWNHAPGLACPGCGSRDLAFEDVSGRGTLFSWTVIKEAPAPGFRDKVPLIVGIVELAEQPHLLLAANIQSIAAEDLRIGLPLAVSFEQVTADCALPQFHPAGD